MQKFILKQKTRIAFISLVTIVLAFFNHYLIHISLVSEALLIFASIIGAIPIAIQAYQALKVKVISIDVLVTIAVVGALMIKNYEESAIVTFLFLFGSYLEQRTLNKTRKAIKELTQMAPVSALKKIGSDYIEVGIEEVLEEDVLLVKTGSKVPVDGIVIDGEGYINEASITGESFPVKKSIGLKVFAGTILENGTIHVEAEKVGEDTTFGKIIELVEEAQDSKSVAEKFIDRFSKYYTPLVLLLAVLVYLIWTDLELAITILVLGCPGALVIGVPVSNVAGIGNGAKNGILLKGSEVISDFSKLDVMVFDKTGTLTTGTPAVNHVKTYTKDSSLALAYLKSVEKESDHPLAKAIVDYIKEDNVYVVNKTNIVKGGGILAQIDEKKVAIGNLKLMKDINIPLSKDVMQNIKQLESTGHSIVITAIDHNIELLIGIKDQIRPNLKQDLQKIKRLGVKELIILSGDNQGTVDLVALELGLTKAYGNMLPEDKQAYIKKLQSEGKRVAFVGDGVNDSPSLALANIGIAMGSGTDVAIETSNVVLMNSNFSKIPHALGLAKKIVINMKQNIIIAVSVVLVLLASVLFSQWMNMSIGMLVHELSILVVIVNGMRLLKYKIKKEEKLK